MAEIPVKKKSGMPWWAWLLIALVVIALIWWLVSAMGDDDVETTPVAEAPAVTAPVVPEVTAEGGPITDLTTIFEAADRNALVGREVQLSGVPVQEVVGDRTFFVGETAERRILVVLDQVLTPGQPGVEGRYDVTTGQSVDVSGSIQRVADIPGTIEGLPSGTDVVIRAQRLNVVSRP